jgi:hypothetical protein
MLSLLAAASEGGSSTVGPSAGLILWTLLSIAIVVGALYAIVRWGRNVRRDAERR